MLKRSASRDACFSLRALLGFTLGSVSVLLALLALSVNSSSTAKGSQGATGKVTVIYPYHHDVSAPMSAMPDYPDIQPPANEGPENPKILIPHIDKADTVAQRSSLLSQLAPSIPSPILNFDGIPDTASFCGCEPPDTNGAVGQTQYVQIVNDAYQVFDKATGNSLQSPKLIASIWSGFGGACELHGFGDPVVLYDHLANRWMISEFASPNGSTPITDQCIAVSTTNNATGSYNRYGYHLGSNFFDYPKLSLWPDAYYMSDNVFNSTGTAYLGVQPFAFDRAAMIAGNPTAALVTTGIVSGGSSNPPMLPSDLDGSTLPTAGAPNSFIMFPANGNYQVFHFHVDFVTPANSTFTLFSSVAAAGFTEICPFTRACVPQLQTTAKLDAIGDRLMFRAAYRKFADHESVVSNFTVSSGGVSGVRWFELRNVTAGPVTKFQEATYQPDTTWRWMGSIAMDNQGNMALGYSASSATIHPQIRYTGRLVTDPVNTLPQGEAHLFDGTGSQTDSSFFRWGDYSAMVLDPVDDQTFWYTTEYYSTNSSFNWRTRIGSFKLATGGGGATLVSAASRVTHGTAGTFDVNMPLSGVSGVEDRDKAGTYLAVFTFDTAVTSGNASIVSGTATVGVPTFSGTEMRVPLTGVTNAQIVTIRVSGVNGGGGSNDVPFGFLIADANASRLVDKTDKNVISAQINMPVTSSNFRDDVTADGSITNADVTEVRTHKNTSIP